MKIFSANNPPQAHIVCELLRTNNIDCEVRGEGIFGLQGELPFGESSEPYVWLLDSSQQNKAYEVITQFEQPLSRRLGIVQIVVKKMKANLLYVGNAEHRTVPSVFVINLNKNKR